MLRRITSTLLLSAAIISAGLASAAMLGSTPLRAQESAAYFSATLAQPASDTRVIAGGVLFACAGTLCTGPRSGTRPLRVCSDLRRKVGAIVSFSAQGEDLSDEQLGRCNA